MATKRKKTSAASKTKRSTTAKKRTTKTTATKKRATASKGKSKAASSANTLTLKALRVSTPLTRAQQINYIAECTGLTSKQVKNVIECFEPMIASHLRGPGQITLAGLMKVVAVKKPATKARKGINPFTGEPTIFKAKPARNVVKIRALKKVKDLVA